MGRLYDASVGRAFSLWYGQMMSRVDARGLAKLRREILDEARGQVLEIGAGTGSNLKLYPNAVEELVLVEPSPHMRKALRNKAVAAGSRSTRLVAASGEALPFADDSFDCVVATMVLCTMPHPSAGLDEIARVLRPGGRFLFLEHVRSDDLRLARVQDRLERPWRFLADGCHCNRDSLAAIDASPLTVERVERTHMPLAPPFIKPLIYGQAVRVSRPRTPVSG